VRIGDSYHLDVLDLESKELQFSGGSEELRSILNQFEVLVPAHGRVRRSKRRRLQDRAVYAARPRGRAPRAPLQLAVAPAGACVRRHLARAQRDGAGGGLLAAPQEHSRRPPDGRPLCPLLKEALRRAVAGGAGAPA